MKFLLFLLLLLSPALCWKLWPTYDAQTAQWALQVQAESPQDDETLVSIERVAVCVFSQRNYCEQKKLNREVDVTYRDGLRTAHFASPRADEETLWATVELIIRDRKANHLSTETCHIKLSPLGERAQSEGIKQHSPFALQWYHFMGVAFGAMLIFVGLLYVVPEVQKRRSHVLSGYDFDTGKLVNQTVERKQRNQQLAETKLDIYRK